MLHVVVLELIAAVLVEAPALAAGGECVRIVEHDLSDALEAAE
jgi:hypothetical protein